MGQLTSMNLIFTNVCHLPPTHCKGINEDVDISSEVKQTACPQISSLVFSPTTRSWAAARAAACKFGFLDTWSSLGAVCCFILCRISSRYQECRRPALAPPPRLCLSNPRPLAAMRTTVAPARTSRAVGWHSLKRAPIENYLFKSIIEATALAGTRPKARAMPRTSRCEIAVVIAAV